MKQALRGLLGAAIFLMVFVFFIKPVHAATITVTATTDDLTNNSNCTLREAVKAANTNLAVDSCTAGSASGTDTIILAGSEYDLSISGAGENSNATGDLDITSNITLQGTDRNTTLILGNDTWDDRVIEVRTGGTLTATDITIGFGNVTGDGGGLLVAGTANLTRADIALNTASAMGGGIRVENGATFSGQYLNIYFNSSTADGGGIDVYTGGTAALDQSYVGFNSTTGGTAPGGGIDYLGTGSVKNSTIEFNQAAGLGGGIMTASTSLLLDSNTIYSNSAGTIGGGGIYSSNAIGNTLQRSIVADNFLSSDSSETECAGTMVSGDYNLVLDLTGCTLNGTTTHNIVGQEPLLGTLSTAANGTFFRTQTYGSPGIDTAGASCLAVDVADTSRPQRGTHGPSALCDIGAFEYIIDETAPVVTASINVSGVTTNNQPTLTINSNEDGTISYYCSPGSWSSSITSISAGVQTTVQLNVLSDGVYGCHVNVTDAAQNTGFSSDISFTVDVVPVTLTVVTPVANYTNNPKVVIRSSKFVTLTYAGCSGNVSSMNGNTDTTVTISGMAEGMHTCSVLASDAIGVSVGSSVGDFTYDITPPTLAYLGDANPIVPFGSLADSGAVAYDALSGIDSNGVVTTRMPYSGNRTNDGTYYGSNFIKYVVKDRAGNSAFLIRSDTVPPKVETIPFSQGSFTVTRPNGTKVVETPFGKNFAVATVVRKVTFVKNVWVVYFAMTIGPTRQWQLKLYDVQGVEIKNLYQESGGYASKLTVPSSFSARGVNWSYAFDPLTYNFYVALGSKSGSNVPRVFPIRPFSDRKVAKYQVFWSVMTQKTRATSGNVLVKFISLDGFSKTLVSSAGGRTVAWKGGFGNYTSDFKENTNVISGRFRIVNNDIKLIAPVKKTFSITPSTPGNVTLQVVLDKSGTTTLKYGISDSSSRTSVTQTNNSSMHTFNLSLLPNKYYEIIVTACTPGLTSAVGCSTSYQNYLKTL